MYKYIYVESNAQSLFQDSQHRDVIDKYSKEGWRFVAAIPASQTGEGRIKKFDLVFEKEKI